MKKIAHISLLAVFAVLFLSGHSVAQRRKGGFIGERLVEFRRSFLTQSIALNNKDSIAFWNIYEKHEAKIKEIRKRQFALYQSAGAKSDEQIKADLQKHSALLEEEWQANKKISEELQKVLTARQILLLYKAEREVRKALLRRIAVGGELDLLDE